MGQTLEDVPHHLQQFIYVLPLLNVPLLCFAVALVEEFDELGLIRRVNQVGIELLQFLVQLVQQLHRVLVHMPQLLSSQAILRLLLEEKCGLAIKVAKRAGQGLDGECVVGEIEHELFEEAVVVLLAVFPYELLDLVDVHVRAEDDVDCDVELKVVLVVDADVVDQVVQAALEVRAGLEGGVEEGQQELVVVLDYVLLHLTQDPLVEIRVAVAHHVQQLLLDSRR